MSTPGDIDYAIALHQSGKSVEDAARGAGVCAKRLRRILRERGVSRPTINTGERAAISKRAKWEPFKQQLIDDYVGGASENVVAKKYGVTRGTARRILEIAGVEIRGQKTANQLMMSKRSFEENRRNTEAARAVTRATNATSTEVCKIKRALTKQKMGLPDTGDEALLKQWFDQMRYYTVPQQAIGIYNIDIAFSGSKVAVEVFGGNWHFSGQHLARFAKRCKYLFDNGWSLIIVWISQGFTHPLTIDAANQVISYLKELRLDPSLRGQCWMIRGNGELVATCRLNDENIATIITPRSITNAIA